MIGIAINGQKLHEVQMLMLPESNNSVYSLLYPKSRIKFDINEENEIILRIPSMLALELYRKQIIPANPKDTFSIHISGEKKGDYRIVDFRYPGSNSFSSEDITVTIKKQKQRNKNL